MDGMPVKREIHDSDSDSYVSQGIHHSGPDRKRNRRSIDLDMKLTVLRLYEEGQQGIDIARFLDLPPSTVRTIRKNADKIKAGAKHAVPLNAKKITRSRSALMESMESLLAVWIQDHNQNNVPLTASAIQEKAKSLYSDLATSFNTKGAKVEEFGASRGWLERFKKRSCFSDIQLSGEMSEDIFEVHKFPQELQAVIDEGGYSPKQVFNVDETGLYWKRLPARTMMSVEEQAASGFKAANDRLSLLLGGNAEGDFKFKPLVVYHTQTPTPLKGYSKEHLRVTWRANKKAWLSGTIFEEWLNAYAIPSVKEYCARENLPFKILFVLDQAPCHPPHLLNLSDNVKFAFLPLSDSSLLQPMDQGITALFKCYYLQHLVQQLLSATDGETKITPKDFWNNYDILKAIDNIADAWEDVSSSCMNNAWEKIWPDCVSDMASLEQIIDILEMIKKQISYLAYEADFEGMEQSDIEELLASHSEERSEDEQVDLQTATEDEEEGPSKAALSRVFTVKRLAEFFKHIDHAMKIINEDDANRERSCRVARIVAQEIGCYKDIYLEKKKKKNLH
ncbi:tigger transposable element-derived protein 1-like [Physella acuta]|uniref:tigger transposable element-derived protein 1-like n=1 Tax=Physella acuta TaxID=109671 RepID=UPI0027DD74DB|nr:tigger transposable element-derived protein 1-like [Physella acuta]